MFFYKIKNFILACLVQSRFLFWSILLYPVSLIYKLLICRKPLWLIGENEGKCLGDNGYTFFKFCRENYSDRRIYFITRKESLENDSFLSENSNVILFGTKKHIFFFLLADTLIYSHAHSDVGYIQIIRLLKRNCGRIFLGHGVTGFKHVHRTYRKNHNEMDLFVVVSDFEKKIIEQNFDFDKKVIRVLGFARYDNFSFNELPPTEKSILYMPTWRDWAFTSRNSDIYINGITSLLNNEQLIYLLERHDVKFSFYIHDKMLCHLGKIKASERVCLVNLHRKYLQEILKSSSLLITDYSSVAWDFFYLGRPVLFYQFDREEYLLKRGSYIDFNCELFGEVFRDCDSLVESLEKYILSNFAELSRYALKRDNYFKYRDANNCQRIYNAILTI